MGAIKNMEITNFFGGIDLHDSMVESISYNDLTKELLINIDFLLWRQPFYNVENDPEIINKTLKFSGVSYLETVPNTLIFDSNEILEVKFLPASVGEQVEFILNNENNIIKFSIQAQHVEWFNQK